MSHNEATDQRRGWRGTAEARKRRRLRPTLMALEERKLLSNFTVNSTLDDGSDGTLRWAVGQANSTGGPDTIDFDSTVFSTPQTIPLTTGPLTLTDAATTTISGPGAGLLSISGNNAGGVFVINYGSATLSGLTITGGGAGNGAGLNNFGGTTTLTDCTVSGNSASDDGGGVLTSGVYNYYSGIMYGITTLTSCTVSGNSAYRGGGLYTYNYGTTTLTNCTVSGNSASDNGGGVFTSGYYGATTLINCTVSDNSAGNNGGGLVAAYIGTSTLTDCTVSGNSAGSNDGGLANDRGRQVALTDCTVSGNSASLSGGGLGTFGSTTTLTDCTVSGNSAPLNGGGLYNRYGTSALTDCTVSGNSASNGGGLYNDSGTSTLTDCTIDQNFGSNGGGVFTSGFSNPYRGTYLGNVTLTDCTVSGNSASKGGGLFSSSYAASTLSDCTVSDNSAGNGGGLFDFGGATTLTNSTVSGNSAANGGGLYDFDGTTALTNSTTISGNMASNTGGGLFDAGGTTILAGSSTISGNAAGDAGGGVATTGGTTTLIGSTASGNWAVNGGGLTNSGGTTTLTDATVSGNTASAIGGGLASSGGTITLTDSTVIGNSAGTGGGLYNNSNGSTTLTNSTVSGNSAGLGGGLFIGATTTLTNTIVAGQTAGGDIVGAVSGSYNLVGTGGSGGLINGLDGNIVGVASPGLAPLGDYGGPTQTMALLAGSPAIDAGTDGAGIPATDQRGALRGLAGLDAGTAVDIGAYEASSSYLVSTTADSFDVGTLRAGVAWANISTNVNAANIASPASNTIVFDTAGTFATPRTITLSSSFGTLELSNASTAETITSPVGEVTVSGGGTSRVFQIDGGATAIFSGLTISNGSTIGNGGGLYNDGGTTTLTDCSISGNSAGSGGGLATFGGSTALANCTISGNSAAENGGGVYNKDGTTTLADVTVSGDSAGDSGGGLANVSGTVTIGNTIVAVNTAATCPDASGGLNSQGNNLIGETDGSFGWVGSDLTGTVVLPVDPMLAPLGSYGGPTRTMALLPGSPAIDAGKNALIPAGLTTDQRGFTRIVDGIVDIGAFEDQSGPLVVSTTVEGTPGKLDLRGAVDLANVMPGGHEITFDPTVFASAQTITLTGAQLELSNTSGTETITGPAAGVTVSGGGLSRVFQVDSGVTAMFRGVIISDGSASNGGGLYNDGGTTTLTDCTVSGNSASGDGGGLFDIAGTTTLIDSTVSSNTGTVNGGGLYDFGGTTALTNSTVTGNSASRGGGLFNYRDATTLTNSTVSGNSAFGRSAFFGGGLYNYGGTTTLNNCTVSGNTAGQGAGLFNNYGSTIALTNCTISGNSSSNGGGGLWNYSSTATLTNCIISGNSARGGGGLIDSYSTTTLTGCTVSGNFGGGMVGFGGTTTLTGCTLSGNSANQGGGLWNYRGGTTLTDCTVSGNSASNGGGLATVSYGTTTLTDCTVSGNSASGNGGGLATVSEGTTTLTDCTVSGNSASNGSGLCTYYYGTTKLTNCTVSGNSASGNGGGLYSDEGGTVIIGNTIVAKNLASTMGPDALGTVASRGNNLVGETDGSSGWVASDLTGTVAQPLDALLAPSGSYGGPTQTVALLPGSPAIDAGNNVLIPAGVTTDQRGLPGIVNNVVDIGAFESSGFTITVTSGSLQSAGVLTAFSAPLTVTVAANNPVEPVAAGLIAFNPPSSGASASPSASPATISSTGTASVTATANGIVGSYAVSATASGATTPASFSLTNDQLIIALDPSAARALLLVGNASINIPGVVYVDSSSSNALMASGNAQVSAAAIDVHGGVNASGNASLSPSPITGAPVLAVASLPSPSITGMTDYGSFSLGGHSSATIQPGIYRQISVSADAKLTMSSGIYIIEGGGLAVSGNASVTGSGVMIVNAGSNYPGTRGTYGSITLGGNATCSLSPATSGIYAGIVFFQPLDNTRALDVLGSASGITGTIYAPAARLSESGNAKLNASLIVDALTIGGNGIADGPTAPSDTMSGGRKSGNDISSAILSGNNLIGTVGSGGLIDRVAGTIIGVVNTWETVPEFEPAKPNKSDSAVPIKIKMTDAQGNSVGWSTLPVVSMSVIAPDGNPVRPTAPANSRPGSLFSFSPITWKYQFNLKTKGHKTTF